MATTLMLKSPQSGNEFRFLNTDLDFEHLSDALEYAGARRNDIKKGRLSAYEWRYNGVFFDLGDVRRVG